MADMIQRQKLSGASPQTTDEYLATLGRITVNLRTYGLYLLLLTVLNVITVVVLASRIGLPFTNIGFLSFEIAFTSMTILCAALHDTLRRKGEVLFEEISDELHWRQKETHLDSVLARPDQEDRPTLDARVILRSFAYASDLPLIPSKFGPAIYVAINLLLLFMTWYLNWDMSKHFSRY